MVANILSVQNQQEVDTVASDQFPSAQTSFFIFYFLLPEEARVGRVPADRQSRTELTPRLSDR